MLCDLFVMLLWIVVCIMMYMYLFFFFFKQKTAYELRISVWSSDVCSSDLHAEIVCRFAGDDADRATDGVASEQRTLRALQDLDAFHVEKIDIRPGGTREVDTIDIGADARVEVECEVVLADAADES